MVICDEIPESWSEESWTEHVFARSKQADHRFGVRNPLPEAEIELTRSEPWSISPDIGPVSKWIISDPDPENELALTLSSFKTSRRCDDVCALIEPAVLRVAKEKGIRWVQCVVPVAIDGAKHYEPFTRLQMIVWGETPSIMSQALLKNAFRPVAYKEDPIGIDVGWIWENPYR